MQNKIKNLAFILQTAEAHIPSNYNASDVDSLNTLGVSAQHSKSTGSLDTPTISTGGSKTNVNLDPHTAEGEIIKNEKSWQKALNRFHFNKCIHNQR